MGPLKQFWNERVILKLLEWLCLTHRQRGQRLLRVERVGFRFHEDDLDLRGIPNLIRGGVRNSLQFLMNVPENRLRHIHAKIKGLLGITHQIGQKP